MNKLELNREISVECHEVLGTVGLPQKREYIIFILRIADGQGVVSSTDVSRELLGNGRLMVARRLLKQCEHLQLLKDDGGERYRLTDTGLTTLRQGMVYIEVESVWRVWTTTDVLVPQKVLLVEEVKNLQRGVRSEDGQADMASEMLPQLLKDVRNQILNIPFGEYKSCTLNFKDRCAPRKDLDKKVLLTLQSDEAQTRVILSLDSSLEQIDVLNTQQRMIVDELMSKSMYFNKWEKGYHVLATTFKELNDTEITSMSKTIHIDSPEIDELGKFDAVQFSVVIYPESQLDTDDWANWFISRMITDFVVNGKYEDWKQNVAEKFPLRKPEFKTVLDKRNEYITNSDGRRMKEYWYLSAAVDWNLEGACNV